MKVLLFSFFVMVGFFIFGSIGHTQTEQSTIQISPNKKADPASEKNYQTDSQGKKTKLELTTTFRAQSIEDNVLNSKMAGGILEAAGEREFTSYLATGFDAGMLLLTGTFTNRYTSEGAPPTGVELYKALVDFHPTTWASLQIGVLDIDFSSLLSTFNTQGFPGLRETFTTKNEVVEASLLAAQTIPTSPTPEVRSSEAGVNTTMNLVTAAIATNPEDKDNFTAKATATHFQFSNLTSSAATDSKFLGNTTINVGTQARFKYLFEGNEFAGQLKIKATNKLKFELTGSQLVNDKAPDGSNKATLVTGSGTYALNGVNIALGGGAFANETDSLPASYTFARLGYNNRFGWTANFAAEFEKQKTTVFTRFVQANEMETQNRSYQADRQILIFGVEAKYEIL